MCQNGLMLLTGAVFAPESIIYFSKQSKTHGRTPPSSLALSFADGDKPLGQVSYYNDLRGKNFSSVDKSALTNPYVSNMSAQT